MTRVRIACCTGFAILFATLFAACNESTAPRTARSSPSPTAATRDLQATAGANNLHVIDQFSCSTWDMSTYYCDYTGTASYEDDPYQWVGSDGYIPHGSVDCQSSPIDCRGAGGNSPPPEDKSICIPNVDPNCEQLLPDSLKTKISATITTFVKNPSTITDLDLRARCQAMLDAFNSLLAAVPPRVFIGGSDTPQGNPYAHYGAYSPETNNIHFDPWALQNLNTGSDRGWQIANTALHEAAHVMGYDHTGAQIIPYRGRTPVYASDELYFKDLNPGAGCMKP